MPVKKFLLATRNQDKIYEIKKIFTDTDIDFITINDIKDLPQVVEDEKTLEGNAIKKALTLFNATKIATISDDTGLEVDALNGEPGVFSARYAGENATSQDNIVKLVHNLKDIPLEKRTAQFRTVVALVTQDGVKTFSGICKGQILDEKRGESGFGYDPVFYVPEMDKTFSEMDITTKNKLSHRGKAFKELYNYLKMSL